MAAYNLTESLTSVSQFSFPKFTALMKPFLFVVAGITLYSLFIFKFYRFLAKRDILQLKKEEFYQTYEGFTEKAVRLVFYILENLILVPLIVFFWFVVLVSFLFVMSKNMDLSAVLLMSAAFVAAVRIIAYYDEGLAQDLAKLVPLTLLVIFITDVRSVSLTGYLDAVKQLPILLEHLVYYLMIVTPLEFALRITHGIASLVIKKELQKEP